MKSPHPPKPAPSVATNPLIDRFDPTQRKVLLVGLVAFFILAASTTLLLAYYVFEPEITALLQKSTPTQAFTLIKTPTCAGASLQLGASSWSIESIQRGADGSLIVPEGIPGVAYWIENMENNTVFALSPTPDNMALLSSVQAGEEAILTWENCNSATYYLSAPQSIEQAVDILANQSLSGIVVYVPVSPSTPGLLVQGYLVGETITAPATFEPAPSEVNTEISLLETSTTPDGANIQVVISILNFGSGPITFSSSDVTLIPEGVAPLGLSQSDPILPQEIMPGESKTFSLVFPHPATDSATLKIFTVEYDLDNY